MSSLVPMVIEQTNRGERSYDIYSRLLKDRIIILGDVGDDVAESIIRGVVYVKGEIKSLGNNAKFDELTFQDSLELEETLSKYEFDIDDYSKFKKIVPKSTRPFYGH